MSEEKRAMKTKSLIRRGYSSSSSSSSKARSAIETVVGRGRIRSGCQDFPKRASHEGASIECGNVRATTPWPISDCRGVPLAKFRQRYPETDTHSFFFLSVWLRFFFFLGVCPAHVPVVTCTSCGPRTHQLRPILPAVAYVNEASRQ